MIDADLRALERRSAQGDQNAAEALARARERLVLPSRDPRLDPRAGDVLELLTPTGWLKRRQVRAIGPLPVSAPTSATERPHVWSSWQLVDVPADVPESVRAGQSTLLPRGAPWSGVTFHAWRPAGYPVLLADWRRWARKARVLARGCDTCQGSCLCTLRAATALAAQAIVHAQADGTLTLTLGDRQRTVDLAAVPPDAWIGYAV